MDVELQYRTELVDRFIAELDRLAVDQWRDLVRLHRRDDAYFRLSGELAAEATQLLGSSRSEQYRTVLEAGKARIAALLARDPALERDVADAARSMAGAAINGLLVQHSDGFNAGAFAELVAPFRPYVDLPDLERSITRRLTPPGQERQRRPGDGAADAR